MGFILTILYLLSAYLGPDTLFGSLASAHVGVILAILIVVVSIPTLGGSYIWRTPQSLAVVGMALAVFMSIAVATGWIVGGAQSFMDFIPNAFAYFLLCLHCNSTKKLKIVILMLLSACLFVIARGYYDLQHGLTDSDYLLAQLNDAGQWFYRIRGMNFVNDPNDFGQMIICVIPLMFIFWRKGKSVRNTAFVLLPVGILLFGAYLTHSRGASVALVAMVIVAGRRRVGTVPAAVIAALLFVLGSALHFTGGREISASAGADRTILWGEGLQLLKAYPLFGVGYGNMTNWVGHTAHNSLVVCCAELGFFGLYFWSLFLFSTARDVLAISSPEKLLEGEPIATVTGPFAPLPGTIEEIDKAEIARLGRLIMLSLTGFLVAGWFLSRAFVLTFFLLGGAVEVLFEMALQRKMVSPRMPMRRMFVNAFWFAISLVFLMYFMLRTVNLLH